MKNLDFETVCLIVAFVAAFGTLFFSIHMINEIIPTFSLLENYKQTC